MRHSNAHGPSDPMYAAHVTWRHLTGHSCQVLHHFLSCHQNVKWRNVIFFLTVVSLRMQASAANLSPRHPERLLPSSNSFSVGASRQIMLGGCFVLKRSFCASCKSCNSLVVSSSFRWTRKASATYRHVTQVRVRPDTSHWQPQHLHTLSSLLAHVEHNAFILFSSLRELSLCSSKRTENKCQHAEFKR